jgi:hypothetical protein
LIEGLAAEAHIAYGYPIETTAEAEAGDKGDDGAVTNPADVGEGEGEAEAEAAPLSEAEKNHREAEAGALGVGLCVPLREAAAEGALVRLGSQLVGLGKRVKMGVRLWLALGGVEREGEGAPEGEAAAEGESEGEGASEALAGALALAAPERVSVPVGHCEAEGESESGLALGSSEGESEAEGQAEAEKDTVRVRESVARAVVEADAEAEEEADESCVTVGCAGCCGAAGEREESRRRSVQSAEGQQRRWCPGITRVAPQLPWAGTPGRDAAEGPQRRNMIEKSSLFFFPSAAPLFYEPAMSSFAPFATGLNGAPPSPRSGRAVRVQT